MLIPYIRYRFFFIFFICGRLIAPSIRRPTPLFYSVRKDPGSHTRVFSCFSGDVVTVLRPSPDYIYTAFNTAFIQRFYSVLPEISQESFSTPSVTFSPLRFHSLVNPAAVPYTTSSQSTSCLICASLVRIVLCTLSLSCIDRRM